jgi:predicted DsbA family dithiol-disulfide isomerase
MKTLPTIHIWSDIACPFCMIGKKRLFDAMPENAQIVWHSFILQPDQITDPNSTLNEVLAKSKGWSTEQTTQIQAQVTQMAAEDGLVMNMDRVVPANTTRAHLLIQMHKNKPTANALVAKLFAAYFTDGKNIDDLQVLQEIHSEVGGSASDWEMIDHPEYRRGLQNDLQMAAQMGVRGVPFFYFEDHFTISGAREPEVFRQAIGQFSVNQSVSE